MKLRSVLLNVDGAFKKLKLEGEKLTKEQARKQVASMQKDLRDATPVDTGYARSRWKTTEVGEVFLVENDAPYIQYLNAGTSKQAPSHFVEGVALKYGQPLGTIVEVKDN